MQRRYDFDWLRLFGSILVVAAHCAGLFASWFPTFGNVQKEKLFDEMLWNLNLWLMPLFMLLAGASVWCTLNKRSNRQYLRERLLHLGVPLLVLTPILGVPIAYAQPSATGEFTGSLVDYALHFFDFFPSGAGHLWFLAYLLIYTVLTLPLFLFLKTIAGRRFLDKLARISQHTGGLYVFALPFLAVQLAFSGLWLQPGYSLPNDWTRFMLLLLDFVCGYILLSDARFQQAIARQWPLALASALATSTLMFIGTWPDSFDPTRDVPLDYSVRYVAFWTLFAFSSWSWLLTWLGFGQRYLNVDHPWRRVASGLSYPIYLLHPLFVWPGVYLIAQWPINPFVAFPVLTTFALGGTVALSIGLGRLTLMRSLLGLKEEQATNLSRAYVILTRAST